MAKLDRAKEELGWLKVVFAVVTAIGASLVVWVAQADDATSALWLIMACIAMVAAGAVAHLDQPLRLPYDAGTGDPVMEWRELLVAVSFGIFMVCILIVAGEAIWHAHRK